MTQHNDFVSDTDLLTASEVGERFRLPLSTVYYLAKQGKLRGFRVGRAWRFRVDEISRVSAQQALATSASLESMQGVGLPLKPPLAEGQKSCGDLTTEQCLPNGDDARNGHQQ